MRGIAQFEGNLSGRLGRRPGLYGVLVVAAVFVLAVVTIGPLLGHALGAAAGLEELRRPVRRMGTDLVAVAFLVWLLSRSGRWRAVGFTSPSGWHSLQLLAFPAVIALITTAAGFATLDTSKTGSLALAAPYAFLTGLWEEGLIRGFLLSMLLVATLRSGRGPVRAVVASAVIFGLMHFAGLIGGRAPSAVLIQVVYATFVGIGFGALQLRTNALWLLVALHALFDLENALPGKTPAIVPVIVVFSYMILAVWGLFLLRRIKDPRPDSSAATKPAEAGEIRPATTG